MGKSILGKNKVKVVCTFCSLGDDYVRVPKPFKCKYCGNEGFRVVKEKKVGSQAEAD